MALDDWVVVGLTYKAGGNGKSRYLGRYHRPPGCGYVRRMPQPLTIIKLDAIRILDFGPCRACFSGEDADMELADSQVEIDPRIHRQSLEALDQNKYEGVDVTFHSMSLHQVLFG